MKKENGTASLTPGSDRVRLADLYSVGRLRAGMGQHLLARALFAGANFASILILVRWMSIADYAAYTVTTGLITLATALSVFGIDRVTSRFLPEFRATFPDQQVAINLVMETLVARAAATVLAMSLLIFLWEKIARTFSLPNDSMLLLPVLLHMFCLAMAGQATLYLQSFMLQREIRVAISIQSIVRVAGLIGATIVTTTITPAAALWILAASEALGLIWLERSLMRELRSMRAKADRTHPSRDNSYRGRIIKTATLNYAYYLAGQPSQNYFLKLVAATHLTAEIVAAYGLLHTLADRLKQHLPTHLFMSLIEPAIVSRSIASGDMRKANDMIGVVLKINAMVLFPIIGWVAVAGDEIVTTLSGGRYGQYGWILAVFILQAFLSSHAGMLMLFANASDCSEILPKSTVLATVISLSVIAGLLSTWGVVSLVLGGTVYIVLNNIFQVWMLRKAISRHRYRIDWRGLFRLVSFAAVATVCGYGVMVTGAYSPFVSAVISGMVIAAIFFACCLILKVFGTAEREMAQKIAGRIRVPI